LDPFYSFFGQKETKISSKNFENFPEIPKNFKKNFRKFPKIFKH